MARPTKYKDEYPAQAEKLCKLGATDEDLADFFDVTIVTIHRWRARHEKFCKAIKVAKEEANDRVERSLYQRAVGYTHEEDKVFQHNGEPVIVPTRKHYPPDATSMIFWLKNRRKEEWRDKFDHDVQGNVTIDAGNDAFKV